MLCWCSVFFTHHLKVQRFHFGDSWRQIAALTVFNEWEFIWRNVPLLPVLVPPQKRIQSFIASAQLLLLHSTSICVTLETRIAPWAKCEPAQSFAGIKPWTLGSSIVMALSLMKPPPGCLISGPWLKLMRALLLYCNRKMIRKIQVLFQKIYMTQSVNRKQKRRFGLVKVGCSTKRPLLC